MLSGTKINITRETIAEKVSEVLSLPSFKQGVDKSKLISELEERFTVWTDDAKVLSNDDDHIAWLPAKKGEMLNWPFWDRYKLFLGKSLPAAAVESVDKVTDEVLSRLEDPNRAAPWDRRGLVMGHVQSGKTGNYTGLICKAADAGYKVIIVLAGMHNNLRSQTQIRLDDGFLGYKAKAVASEGEAFEATGVGKLNPGPRADSVTNRNDNGDFKGAVASQFAISPGGKPLLFVVKKNVSVLKNLLKWIRSSTNVQDPSTGRKIHRDVPILVIDDEADQASVDTKAVPLNEDGEPDADHDPTATNSLIRKLLYSFDKSAYVGYTATPFANIYIHEKNRTDDAGEDLFPRSFIVNIPPPSNYTGAARIFGITKDEDAGIEVISSLPICRTVDDYAAKRDRFGRISEEGVIDRAETVGWMPPRLVDKTDHIPIFDGEEQLPHSLQQAVLAFILSTAARELREGMDCHNSMLVHVVRFKNVQARVASQIEEFLGAIRNRLKNGDGNKYPTIKDEFKKLWTRDFVATSSNQVFSDESLGCLQKLPDWHDISEKLWAVTAGIEVRTINGSAGDVLDYDNHPERGLNVIANGGDKLSRGLTLEGLTVSYFLRASRMYDTLMQMGRWFGYRSKYIDVCRLYTTADLIEWFTHIAAATEELREEFEHMVNVGGTPRDYGLKVRSHPVLLVTSAVKMRNGTEVSLSYAGDISETIIYDIDEGNLKGNLHETSTWLASLKPFADKNNGISGYYWNSVPSASVVDFLSGYKSHDDARRADTDLLTKYIQRQNQQNELTEWGVYLVSNSKGDSTKFTFPNIGDVGLIRRSPFPKISEADSGAQRNRYTIRRLVSPADEARDLTRGTPDSQWEEALKQTIENWKLDDRQSKPKNEPQRPGGREIRSIRSKTKGLLMLYPLDPKQAGFDFETPFVGIAISFPSSETAREISYTVNNIFTASGDLDSL